MGGGPRAWGWVAALRSGATVPWSQWAGEADAPAGDRSWLPGAQQLELLRRVNEAASTAGVAVPVGLPDRILGASAPGRGRPDLPLAGAAGVDGSPEASTDDAPRFGPRPVDPSDVPARELVRLASGLIARDVAAGVVPHEKHQESAGTGAFRGGLSRRPAPQGFALAGDPVLVRSVEADLRARGRHPRRRVRRAHVLGADLETMVAHAWAERVLDEGDPSYADWIEGFVGSDRVPPRIDLAAAARRWGERVGTDRTVVVLDLERLPGSLRMRSLTPPPVLGAAGADLVRRTGAALGVLVPPAERAPLLRARLVPRLTDRDDPLPAVPASAQAWLDTAADRMRRDLTRGGYPVLGGLGRLLEPSQAGGAAGDPAEESVLALAIGLLLDPVTDAGAVGAVGAADAAEGGEGGPR